MAVPTFSLSLDLVTITKKSSISQLYTHRLTCIASVAQPSPAFLSCNSVPILSYKIPISKNNSEWLPLFSAWEFPQTPP